MSKHTNTEQRPWMPLVETVETLGRLQTFMGKLEGDGDVYGLSEEEYQRFRSAIARAQSFIDACDPEETDKEAQR